MTRVSSLEEPEATTPAVREFRSAEIRVTVEIPEAEREIRSQPYSINREYQTRRVVAVFTRNSTGAERGEVVLSGPLVIKSGFSSKVTCDERLWTKGDPLEPLPPLTRAWIALRVGAWRSGEL